MNGEILRVIEVLATKTMQLAQAILQDDTISTNPKVGVNTLANSRLFENLRREIELNNTDIIIHILFNHYVAFIEWERPPRYRKRPPISALETWAADNGISTDANTLWAISYAIWEDGHAARPIFATLDVAIRNYFNNEFSENLFNAITRTLTDFFNN